MAELALDREALALGKIAITTARGLLPDGTPFSIPDHDSPPAPLDVGADARDTRVMLALPMRRTNMTDVERGDYQDTAARYRTVACEVRDNNFDTAMSWHSKVVWSEGMFLRPQHFQQQDRYLEALVRHSCGYLRPYD